MDKVELSMPPTDVLIPEEEQPMALRRVRTLDWIHRFHRLRIRHER